ncbi:MAG: type II secretion system protein [Planctomycetota bacterium]
MNRGQRGFTLIEILVVMAVLGILLGTSLPLVSALIDRRREEDVRGELESIAQALDAYYFDRASFPSSLADPRFLGAYLNPGLNGTAVRDGWGANVDYGYRRTASPDIATVWSRGPNGVDEAGGGDDLRVATHGSVAGYRKTRARMSIILAALARHVESGGRLSGTWSVDRAEMGLGESYQNDGFGTPFRLEPSTHTLSSSGPDRIHGTPDDLTP